MQPAEKIIRDYYEAFNRADWQAMLAHLGEDVAHDINQDRREVGLEAFSAFLSRMNRCYQERLEDIVVMASADGRRAAAEYVVHGRYLTADEGLPAAHGQTYVLPGGAFFELRDGKLTRITNYYNLQDWLKQVGARGEFSE